MKRKSYITVGRALPGMMDLSRNASSGIKLTDKTVELLEEAMEETGCVVITVKEEKLVGKKMFRTRVAERMWQEKLDDLQARVDALSPPCVFVLFRKSSDVLLVKYIPDHASSKARMLFASSMSSVKNAVLELNDAMRVEEYNVSEPSELSQDEYFKQKNVAAPYSEAEIARQEQESAETGGAYSLLARLSVPVALPGMATNNMPSFLRRAYAADPVEEDPADDEEEPVEDAVQHESDGDEEAPFEVPVPDTPPRKSSSRKSASRKSSSRKSAARKSPARETTKSPSRKSASRKSASRKASSGSAGSGSPKPRSRSPAKPGPVPAKMEHEKVRERGRERERQRERARREAERKARELEEAAAAAEEGDAYPYTYSDLVKMKELGEFDDGMDPRHIEAYMTKKEFVRAFKMTKDEFDELPGWRQTMLKKQLKLF